MKRMKNVGLVLCGTVLGLALSAPAAQAVESLKAMLSTNRIFVDGQEVQIEAYAIHDNNFMQLRDIGKAVGFNVYWDTNTKTVQIETGKPYTGEAPAKDEAADSVSQQAHAGGAGTGRGNGCQRRLLPHQAGWTEKYHRHGLPIHRRKYPLHRGLGDAGQNRIRGRHVVVESLRRPSEKPPQSELC